MQIAQLTPADAMAYKALMLHAYEHAADSFTSTPQERALEPDSWWCGRIDDPSGLTWVWGAFAEAELVGTVSVEYAAKTKTRHKGLIVAMFVHENFRGQGLARKLMRAAIEHGIERQGLRVLQLELTQGNVPAERLYQSLGFQAYGVEPMAVLTANGYRSKVHMWLDLTSGKKPIRQLRCDDSQYSIPAIGSDGAEVGWGGDNSRCTSVNEETPAMTTPVKPKGPASYFPSIEKIYGQPIAHWLAILVGMKDKKHMEQVALLKSEHQLGHGHANALVAFHKSQQSA